MVHDYTNYRLKFIYSSLKINYTIWVYIKIVILPNIRVYSLKPKLQKVNPG
jgi:hypothetical protein